MAFSRRTRTSFRRRRRRGGIGGGPAARSTWPPVLMYVLVLLVGVGMAVSGLARVDEMPRRKAAIMPALAGFLEEGEERLIRQGRSIAASFAARSIVETAIPMFASSEPRGSSRLWQARELLGSLMRALGSASFSEPVTFLTAAIPGFSASGSGRGLATTLAERSGRGAGQAGLVSPASSVSLRSQTETARPSTPQVPSPPSASEGARPGQSEQPSLVRGPSRRWGSEPLVFIYHSHSSEAYRLTSGTSYTWGSDQGVMRVGDALAAALTERYGIPVMHSREVHDYPVWRDAYANSLKTVSQALSEHPSIEMVLDIHRDAAASPAGAPTTIEIRGQRAARVFIVVTSDAFGLPHPNWRENLAFAYVLNAKMDEMYPGLSRGIDVRDDARWNQHVHNRAVILEIGSEENSRQEAEASASLVADVLASVLQDIQD